MTRREKENHWHLQNRMADAGFTYTETETLLRIERTLTRWAELECGTGTHHIERRESDGVPFMYSDTGSHDLRWRTADREKGALKRLASLMAGHPDHVAYHQTDPRGCALYIVAKSDIPEGANLDSCYTRGVAVCI